MKSIRKAVIPAAGFGTRFLPATKAQPKEMLPIVDTPAIQYIVKEALDSGIEEILIITGRSKRAIEDHFDSSVELEELLQKQGKNKQLAMVKDLALRPLLYTAASSSVRIGSSTSIISACVCAFTIWLVRLWSSLALVLPLATTRDRITRS